ncbi:hypothetical protein L1887_31885 [Cichorium endivia]|nr:hypothetical protein L1887_31885 [Cichorium endivia]
MCSSLKVISRIGNRETEYRTEIDLNPCLMSGNILLDEGSYDHLSLDRTDWVKARDQNGATLEAPPGFGETLIRVLVSLVQLIKSLVQLEAPRVSGVACGGYIRNPLAAPYSRHLSLSPLLCWIVFSLLGCDLHLRQDLFAACLKDHKIKGWFFFILL